MSNKNAMITAASLADAGTYRCNYGETPKLTQYNYHEWCCNMKFVIQAKQGLDKVLGDEEPPAPNARDNTMADFTRCAGKAAFRIISTCSTSVKTHIDAMHDSHQMWDVLITKLDIAICRNLFRPLRIPPSNSIRFTLLKNCQ
jgi:hypothetical protein